MEIRESVRQRRNERIREIQEKGPVRSSAKSRGLLLPEPRGNSAYHIQEADEPLYKRYNEYELYNDPEFVWKQKFKKDWLGSSDNPGIGGFRFNPKRIAAQLVASSLLFGALWGLFQLDHPLAEKGQTYVRNAITNELEWSRLSAWYENTFGSSPLIIPVFNKNQPNATKVSNQNKTYFSPLSGTISAPFDTTRLGIIVEAKADSTVNALDTGQVIYAGEREGTGYTIIIQHANKQQSVYGWISKSYVEQNDWIKGGEAVGKVGQDEASDNGSLYFALMKDGQFINPVDVVRFD